MRARMRRELTGWVQRRACSQRLNTASRLKSFRNFCESRTIKQCRKQPRFSRNEPLAASLLDSHPDQTRGAFAGHESAGPTIAGIKKLLVTPEHQQVRT